MRVLLFVLLGAGFSLMPSPASSLLINGNLDLPGLHELDLATGWTLLEGPGEENAATFAAFADHTTPAAGDGVGLWFRAFAGTTPTDPRPAVQAHLFQDVPAIPGLLYTMSGWARFEANWPGGFDLLPSGGAVEPPLSPRWPADTPSPTRTEFALEFLDVADAVLPGSLVLDLHDDLGQTNDNQWHEHTLMAVAPAGTVSVRVRASMIDGVNSDSNPQSAFVDDFSLTAIPEPGTMAMVLIGVGVLALRRRSRVSSS
jgi:hypothetical protein